MDDTHDNDMQRTYSHRSKDDLLALRERLSAMSDMRRAAVVGYAMVSGISTAPLMARLSLRMMQAKFGQVDGTQRFVHLLASRPKQLESLWGGVMGWMTDGKDAHDRLSAGGWNKSELDGLVEFAYKVGMPADPHVPASVEEPDEAPAPSM